MHSCGIDAHKLDCHLHKMKLYSFTFTDNQTEGGGVTVSDTKSWNKLPIYRGKETPLGI